MMLRLGRRWLSVLGRCHIPEPVNEIMLGFGPGSRERANLQAALKEALKQCPEIPCVVGGQAVKTGNIKEQVMPTKHSHVVTKSHELTEDVVNDAIKSALEARKDWLEMPFEQRAAIFLKAADLLVSPKYRWRMMAATMLGQGKNIWQAEIDSIAEMADFWRFNVKYAEEIYNLQPRVPQSNGVWNRMDYRPLEGFVVSIGPFNFAAIGANLASAPALMGNTVIFKPSEYAMASNYLFHEILTEAGLPPGVINFLPGDGKTLGDIAFRHPDFAGVHFTGSTATFNTIWKTIANNVDSYKSYPVIVGETGGKNFHFVHESASLDSVVNQTIRGAFEYQGQKCSASSRLYVPDNKWNALRELFLQQLSTVKKGCVTKFDCLVNAVISKTAYDRIVGYIERARASDDCKIIYGGSYDDSEGFFIEPTVIVTTNPKHEIMQQEVFGPVLAVYVYDHKDISGALKLCDSTSFGLTGAIFAKDRRAIDLIQKELKYTCGNLYVNDKSTGAIVGQQPFGGSRKSGTNDKSGSSLNLHCWVSPQTIKESFVPLRDYRYRHMF